MSITSTYADSAATKASTRAPGSGGFAKRTGGAPGTHSAEEVKVHLLEEEVANLRAALKESQENEKAHENRIFCMDKVLGWHHTEVKNLKATHLDTINEIGSALGCDGDTDKQELLDAVQELKDDRDWREDERDELEEELNEARDEIDTLETESRALLVAAGGHSAVYGPGGLLPA